MKYIGEQKYDFSDVLIIPKYSMDAVSRKDVDLNMQFKNVPNPFSCVPIIAANMDTVGTMDMCDALWDYKCQVALHKHYELDRLVDFLPKANNAWYTLGMRDQDLQKLYEIRDRLGDFAYNICIDVPNGYMKKFHKFVSRIRAEFPKSNILAGNVCTPEGVNYLIESGADIVKIGIGSGRFCTTRKIAGVGYPQLSCVIECAEAAHNVGKYVCSDGGIVMAGDVAKAIGAGADMVMLGGYLGGTDQCEGEWKYENSQYTLGYWSTDNEGNKIWTGNGFPTEFRPIKKEFKMYGMSSDAAMNKHYGGKENYRASEGREVWIPYRGDVGLIIEEILGGLRSCCTYVGATKLKDLNKRTSFVRVNRTHNTYLGD